MSDLVLLAAAMLFTGVVGGFLAGLLGIGGGIVIVPVMEAALAYVGVDGAIRMQVAVATSLATIVPTSIASSRAHNKRSAVDTGLVRRWAVYVLIGALAGTFVASRVHSDVLAAVFAAVALAIAIKMMMPLENKTIAPEVPTGPLVPLIPTSTGFLSSMMGIGGGTFSVMALTLYGQPIHRAVGTAALLGLFISLPGSLGYMASGLGDPRLPTGSIGFVNLIGFALISPMTFIAAPVGAATAHRLGQRQLSWLFGLFLILVAVRMFMQAIS